MVFGRDGYLFPASASAPLALALAEEFTVTSLTEREERPAACGHRTVD
jgi:hypothetical protein